MNISVDWLPQTAYVAFLVFARVGTMLMLVPALGDRRVPTRVRLGFALAFTFVLYPLVSPQIPVLTDNAAAIGLALGHEIAVGLILGGTARLIVMAAQTAGATIAFQAGLSVAQTADPTQGGVQGAMIGNFLAVLGATLVFATNLHHLVLAAIYDSYSVFPTDAPLMLGDAADMALNVVSRSFIIGVQMAAPFIVFGLVFYLGLGILGRLMPQIQVFFIAMPANIGIGFLLMALLLTMMMGWYIVHFENEISMLSGR
jgi:flagellar biosynthetic protein FliR